MTLGDRLKFIQQKTGLTLVEFAKEIGISKESLINYQKNRTDPGSAVIYTVCNKFSVSSEWLLMGQGEPFFGDEPGKLQEQKPEKAIPVDHAMNILLQAEKELGIIASPETRRRILIELRHQLAVATAKDMILEEEIKEKD